MLSDFEQSKQTATASACSQILCPFLVQADKYRKCFEFEVRHSRHFGIVKSIINPIEGKHVVLNLHIFRINVQELMRQSDFLRHLEDGDDDDDNGDCLQK